MGQPAEADAGNSNSNNNNDDDDTQWYQREVVLLAPPLRRPSCRFTCGNSNWARTLDTGCETSNGDG